MARAPIAMGYIGMQVPVSEPASPPDDSFATPSDVKMFAGEGASVDDLKRGYTNPDINAGPEYDLNNYKDRFSQAPSRDFVDDYEFRNKDRTTRGFLTRNRYSDPREG